MAKSLPLWAIAIACFCTDWLFYMLLTSMPTFMSSVLHFDLSEVSAALRLVSAAAMGLGCSLGWKYAVSSGIFLPEDLWLWDQQCRSLQAPGCVVLLPAVQNGLLSSLPYIGNGLGHILAGLLADFLLARRVLGTAAVRKLFSALGRNRLSSAVQPSQHTLWHIIKHVPFSPGMLLPSIFLVAVPYIGCSSTAAVVLLTLALTIISMTGAGININHIDIAPR